MKYITGTFHALAILLLVAVAGLFLASTLPIPGNIEIKVVKSGSMEPAIPVGALVIIKPVETYAVGDIITFGKDTKTEIPTTHRILSIREANGTTYYTTKGDANEEQDPKEVAAREVIGKVLVNVPGAGYVLDFAKQPLGFALMIALPAAIIILDELLAIYREIRRRTRPTRKGPDDGRSGSHLPKEPESGGVNMRSFHTEVRYMRRYVTDDIFLPVRVRIQDVISSRQYTNATTSAFTIAALIISAGNIGGTLSYFRDVDHSIDNVFAAGIWESGSAFDVVLNEFLPNPDDEAGGLNFGDDNDSKPFGEWIELYNKGAFAIDVAGWYMADASGGGGNTHAVIDDTNTNTGDTIIPPGGWLVVYMNKPTLNNTGDEIHLFTVNDVEVDSVSYDDPSSACENNPTPGGGNDSTPPTGTPGNGPNADCIQNQVAPNKSYARIPDGTGPWIDPIPTPGEPNILEEEPAQMLMESSVPEESESAEEEDERARAEREEREERPERENPRGGSGGGGGGNSPEPQPEDIATSTEESGGEVPSGGTEEGTEEQPEETTEESTEEATEEETLPPATVEDTPVVETEEETPPTEPPPPPAEESAPAESATE